MKILFLNHSGSLGGAELSLIGTVKPYRDNCLVCLFEDGPFRHLLEQERIPVEIQSTQLMQVRRESSCIQALGSLGKLVPSIAKMVQLSFDYDLIYANTHKALVVGGLASFLSRRRLVYHLRDILSVDHFSPTNCRIAVTLANYFASIVIANSKATQAAFVAAGGCSDITEVVYNGFDPQLYPSTKFAFSQIRQELGLGGKFLVGHFSRLSPWKGQHILIEALAHCSEDVVAIFVGDALFGEQDYVQQLHQQVTALGLEERVKFLGLRSDVPQLMAGCNVVTHTSTAPEPFGRVIVEAMLCRRPVVAAQAGGAVELVEPGKTGWLVPPRDPLKLAAAINQCRDQPEYAATIASQAQVEASQRFHIETVGQQIDQLLQQVMQTK